MQPKHGTALFFLCPFASLKGGIVISADANYIIPANAWQKVKASGHIKQNVYIYGATGYGKTELIQQTLANRRYLYYSCLDRLWQCLPERSDRPVIVVIDDLQYLFDEERRQEVLNLTEQNNVWLILMGRCQLPTWLFQRYVSQGFTIVTENDLKLDEGEVMNYFSRRGITLSAAEFHYLYHLSEGNPYIIRYISLRLLEGLQFGEEMDLAMLQANSEWLENRVLLQMDSDLLEFLMQISVVDEFTIELAELISGSSRVTVWLEKAREIGNFLTSQEGVYRLRFPLLLALRERAAKVYGTEKMKELAYNAGLYYETRDQIVSALHMFERSGRKGRIRELLIRNARRNAGNGHYYELRQYYLNLPESEIDGSPVLMAGMSMLYSLLMEPDKSEAWYRRLREYAKTARGGEKRECQSRITYLDIALPHRGSQDLLNIFKSIPSLLFNKGIGLPEFSVTSNLPSTMNGGKDFCHWSPMDRQLAMSIGKLVEHALGRYGKGLVNAALGESFYEKGGDANEIIALLTCAELETEQGGTMEIHFAAIGIRVRLMLVYGNLQAAQSLLASFETKVRMQGTVQILPNLEALKCRLALYENDAEMIKRWMKQAPDEDKEFFILERYRYLTKVRCYIAQGAYFQACALLEKLRYYAERFQRTYVCMEVATLTAVVRYRQGKEWKTRLLEALQSAQKYQFLRVICEEGAAVLDLLRTIKKDPAISFTNDIWRSRLLDETEKVARRYPMYLNPSRMNASRFSENALMILRLQADNLTVGQIADRLSMEVETVRYHIKQNYKKLGVSGKAAAVLAARNLGIL